jgi:precorrin-3B C17-methyltransferase
VVLTDLAHLLEQEVGMTTTVIVGSTRSFAFEGFLVTPRGYGDKYERDGAPREGQRPGASFREDRS